jgi:hypothetical protein
MIKRGQLITSYASLSDQLGLTPKQVRRCFDNLKSTGEIETERASSWAKITLCKYGAYQDLDTEEGQTKGKSKGTARARKGQQHKNEKNEKNEKKNIYGEFQNVLFTDEEYHKLKELFPLDYDSRIEKCSSYIASTGKRYQSHYATIRNWANGEKKEKQEELQWFEK